MAKYVCFNSDCRAEIEITDVNVPLDCPYCAGKIFFKQPGNKRRLVKAI